MPTLAPTLSNGLALVAASLLPFSVHAILLSSSTLQSCVKNGATADVDVQCEQKVVVTLAVGNGQALATDRLDFALSCVGSPDGTCPCPCNYLSDDGCECRDLSDPISITVTKSPVWASYPLTFFTSFNYKPYEAIVRPHNEICSDSDWDSNPTCSWYWVGSYKVPDSQGFVCECSSSQIWDTTLGNGNQERTRANLNCDFFSDAIDIITGKPPCSAHCLMFDDLWYSGYELGPPSLQFDITVSVDVPKEVDDGANGPQDGADANTTGGSAGDEGISDADDGGDALKPARYRREQLALSPSSTLATSTSRLVSTHLIGDLVTYTSLPELSSRMLMLPRKDGWTEQQILNSNRSGWMLVRESYLDRTDTDCNKIGTFFSAFRNQPNRCFRAAQSCLDNQLKDLQAEDEARIAHGKVPLHSVTQFTYGSGSMMASFHGGPLSFALPVASQSNSLVLIDVAADSVRMVTNAAPGNISGVRLCQFAETSCGGFEAGASRGYLFVNLTNAGFVDATFTLTVTNCTANVRPVEARTMALPAGQMVPVEPPLQIFVEDMFEDADRHCWLSLYSSQARVVDSVRVTFYTNATVIDPVPTGGLNHSGDGAAPEPGNSTGCNSSCGSFWDVICYVSNSCWGKFGAVLGTVVGVGAAVAGLVVLAKMGLLAACLGGALSCCGHVCGCSRSTGKRQEDQCGSPMPPHHAASLQSQRLPQQRTAPAVNVAMDASSRAWFGTTGDVHMPARAPQAAAALPMPTRAHAGDRTRVSGQTSWLTRSRASLSHQWERLSTAIAGTTYGTDQDTAQVLLTGPALPAGTHGNNAIVGSNPLYWRP